MPDSFAARFAAVRAAYGPLVWGLDPSAELLSAWGLGDTPDGLDLFADLMLVSAPGTVGLVKPQSAFYERHGWRGIQTLQRLVTDLRLAGLLVILDIKRGDVGSTNDAYAEAYLGPDAPLAADAITVHPYLGLAAMEAYVTRAHQSGSCLLVVTRSSNREGRAIQSARSGRGRSSRGFQGVAPLGRSSRGFQGVAPRGRSSRGFQGVAPRGSTVEQDLLRQIGALNARLAPGEIGPVGAVIGPTHMEPELDLAAAGGLFLAPGVGAQGATPADVATVFAACPDRVMPSASRSLLAAGPDVNDLRAAAVALAAEVRAVLAG
jgi:orotidine-5'-phosphate decarboxylase